ncbi:MAG: hypothetical protein WBP47_19505 [Candidatus Promineifilaceae bacterium]
MHKSNVLSSLSFGLFLVFILVTAASAGYGASPETAVSQSISRVTDDHLIFLPMITNPYPPQHKIVFASTYETGGAYDIFLMNTDGTGLQNLTNTPDRSETSPVWSPDGTMIAYISTEGSGLSGDIYIMDANGGNQRNVSQDATSDNIELVWAPDSSRLAFVSDMGNDWYVFDIFVANSDGSGLSNVTNTSNLSERVPHWSSDGRQIVFTSDRSLNTGSVHNSIVKVNADGSGKTAVYADNDGDNFWPQWLPHQSKISFVKEPTNPGCLYTINSDGSGGSCVTQFPGLYIAGKNRWNSAGTKLLLQGYDPLEDYWQYLYTFDLGTGQIQKLVLCSPYSTFDWSPDESQIVYVAREAYKSNIFIANSDGSAPQNLTGTLNSENRDPDWSPVIIP